METGALKAHYQPQVDASGQVIGAECLVRWQHPKRGMVMPNDFIAVAEEAGIIAQLGMWVLECACRQLRDWDARSPFTPLTLSINVSAHQFLQADFVEQVRATLDRTGARADRVKFELTESILVSNVDATIDRMLALKAMGIRFSLDDFGTGFSSLSYLKRLPMSQLKIDRSFVHDLSDDRFDFAITAAIVALARAMDVEVIAEGVETAAQRDVLLSLGCPLFQGYLYSKPLPISDFEKFVIGNSSSAG